MNHYKTVMGAEAKCKKHDDLSRFFNKKAGNNLPILSVLAAVFILKSMS